MWYLFDFFSSISSIRKTPSISVSCCWPFLSLFSWARLSALICLWCTTGDTWSLWLVQNSFAPGYLGQPAIFVGWKDVSKQALHTCHDWNSRVGKHFDSRWYSCTQSSMCLKSSITYDAPSTACINKTMQFRSYRGTELTWLLTAMFTPILSKLYFKFWHIAVKWYINVWMQRPSDIPTLFNFNL